MSLRSFRNCIPASARVQKNTSNTSELSPGGRPKAHLIVAHNSACVNDNDRLVVDL